MESGKVAASRGWARKPLLPEGFPRASGSSPADTLILAQEGPFQTSDLQNRKITTLFKQNKSPTMVQIHHAAFT